MSCIMGRLYFIRNFMGGLIQMTIGLSLGNNLTRLNKVYRKLCNAPGVSVCVGVSISLRIDVRVNKY